MEKNEWKNRNQTSKLNLVIHILEVSEFKSFKYLLKIKAI